MLYIATYIHSPNDYLHLDRINAVLQQPCSKFWFLIFVHPIYMNYVAKI